MSSSLSKVQGPPLRKTEDWVKFDSNYNAEKKPLGTVLVRVALLMAFLAVATALITPPLLFLFPAWKAVVMMIGIVLIYCCFSFIIRPQVDRDTLEWRPGSLTTEPAANLNRLLDVVHWLLAPGRFATETLLDVSVLAGIAKNTSPSNESPAPAPAPEFSNAPQPSPYSRASH